MVRTPFPGIRVFPNPFPSTACLHASHSLLTLTLLTLAVEGASHEGKRKHESIWPVFRINHQRSRYVYDMYYKHRAISKEVYEYCLREGYGDAALIAKWKKPGFENLCCLQCIAQTHNFGGGCICRVPRNDLEPGKIFECVGCGCRGCGSGDARAIVTLPASFSGVGAIATNGSGGEGVDLSSGSSVGGGGGGGGVGGGGSETYERGGLAPGNEETDSQKKQRT